MKLTHIILVGITLVVVDSVYIPKYFKLCGRKDPEFLKCAIESARGAVPIIVNGDKMLNIPNLNPLKLPHLQLQSTESLKLNFTNLEIHGLEKADILDFKIDFDKREAIVDLVIKEVKIIGTYEVQGRVLILPIEGRGPGELTILDGHYTYFFKFDMVTKKGLEYAQLHSDSIKYSLKNAVFKLENLFNGDKQLGDHMNKFLNENSIEILKEYEPVVGQTVASVCRQIASNIVKKIPFDQLFLN